MRKTEVQTRTRFSNHNRSRRTGQDQIPAPDTQDGSLTVINSCTSSFARWLLGGGWGQGQSRHIRSVYPLLHSLTQLL